ncbi:MAG: sugar phosphate isomerase/epimerase family protein, partial [Methanosarcina sp.]
MKQNRREFISTMAAAGAAIPFAMNTNIMPSNQPDKKYPVRLFSKPIDSYDFTFMCEVATKSGIGGFDLTVRKGGKVEPANVETDLPKLVEQAKKHNLAIDMMVTDILSVSDPFTERVLKAGSAAGIKYYRYSWASYENNADIMETIKKYHDELKNVTELNRKYKIHGGYQNHVGARLGAPVWDLYELLRDLPAEYCGSQYDVRHAMVEGANTWMLGMKLISNKIKTLAIKDFTWKSENGKQPQAVTVPMGEGMVNWDTYFKNVKSLKIEGPLTIHVEYPLLEKGEEKLSLDRQQEIIVRKIKKDV